MPDESTGTETAPQTTETAPEQAQEMQVQETTTETQQTTQEPVKSTKEQTASAEIDAILNRGTKPKPDAKATEKALDWKTSPKLFREAHERHVTESQATIKKLESQIAEIQNKKVEAPADAGKIAELEKRIQEAEQKAQDYNRRLAEADYSKSEEFKRDYAEKWNSAYKAAVSETLRYQAIAKVDEDGNPTLRPATQADFDYIRALPVEARRQAAKERFGDNGNDVVDNIKELDRIHRAGMEAISRAQETFESKRKQQEAEFKAHSETYRTVRQQSTEELMGKFPQFFGESKDDPELSAAWKAGVEFFDKTESGAESMTPDKRATAMAIIRAQVGAFPRLAMVVKRNEQKISELTAELAKYRKTDPGSATVKTEVVKTNEDDIGDINSMTAKFKGLTR
jgi:hypothetical protein